MELVSRPTSPTYHKPVVSQRCLTFEFYCLPTAQSSRTWNDLFSEENKSVLTVFVHHFGFIFWQFCQNNFVNEIRHLFLWQCSNPSQQLLWTRVEDIFGQICHFSVFLADADCLDGAARNSFVARPDFLRVSPPRTVGRTKSAKKTALKCFCPMGVGGGGNFEELYTLTQIWMFRSSAALSFLAKWSF